MTIHLCSTNPGKLREFVLAAAATSFQVQVLPRLAGIQTPEETGLSFEEIAAQKAAYYSQFSSELVLADDSGLEVFALHGEPGVRSARFAGPDATDLENNDLLLDRMKGLTHRSARFVSVVALARAGTIVTTVRGEVAGEILAAPRGNEGFGYDPLFFYPPLGRAFAELTPAEKLSVSHRGRALQAAFRSLAG